MIDTVRFFALDETGRLQKECTATAVDCFYRIYAVCGDTPHVIVTVRRGSRMNKVEDWQCWGEGDEDAVAPLEDLVDRLAGTSEWIGH
jgi:hypothetical protein